MSGPPIVNGWTVFTASSPSGEGSGFSGAGTRKIYVDSAAADDTGTGSQASPKKTIAAGYALLRSGSPDWLLLKCGSTWTEVFSQFKKKGLSADEPMLLSTYGTGARPILNAPFGEVNGHLTCSGAGGGAEGGKYVAIVGLDLYMPTKDPNSGSYAAGDTTTAGGISNINVMTWFCVEDCVLRFCGLGTQPSNVAAGGEIRIRRNIIVDTYSITAAHAIGFYANKTAGGLIQENYFDHGGWNEDIVAAVATIFNHNVYLDVLNGVFEVTGNISVRASSHGLQVRNGGTVSDNFMNDNPCGILTGAPPDQDDLHGFVSGPGMQVAQVVDNVITKCGAIGGPGGSARGFGIDVSTVAFSNSAQIANFGTVNTSRNIIYAKANVGGNGHGGQINTLQTGMTATGNIIFNWDTPIDDLGTGNMTTPNQIDENGDNAEYSFVYPTRSLASYDLSVGGPGTEAHFYSVCRARGRSVWDERYSAAAVDDYIRAGFGMRRLAPSFTVNLTATA